MVYSNLHHLGAMVPNSGVRDMRSVESASNLHHLGAMVPNSGVRDMRSVESAWFEAT